MNGILIDMHPLQRLRYRIKKNPLFMHNIWRYSLYPICRKTNPVRGRHDLYVVRLIHHQITVQIFLQRNP